LLQRDLVFKPFAAALLHARHSAAHLPCLASLRVLPLCAASSYLFSFSSTCFRVELILCAAARHDCFHCSVLLPWNSTTGRPSEPCHVTPPPSAPAATCSHLGANQRRHRPCAALPPICTASEPALPHRPLCRTVSDRRAPRCGLPSAPSSRSRRVRSTTKLRFASCRDAVRRARRLYSALAASAPSARRSRCCQPPTPLVSLLPLGPLKLVKRASLVLLVLPSPVLAAGKPRTVRPLPPRRGCYHGRVPPLFGNGPRARFGRPIWLG
jgi:hypothetical protein